LYALPKDVRKLKTAIENKKLKGAKILKRTLFFCGFNLPLHLDLLFSS